MSPKAKRVWWILNVAWWLGLPTVFGIWLHYHVQWEYEMGYRTSTGGDSIGLPIGGVFIWNTLLLALFNIVLWLLLFLRKNLTSRSRKDAPKSGAPLS
jgi:hypothetical protein